MQSCAFVVITWFFWMEGDDKDEEDRLDGVQESEPTMLQMELTFVQIHAS